MLGALPLAAAQCAIMMHARAVNSGASDGTAKDYKAIESAASTDDEDLEAADLGDLEPKLADPVAEQNRLLNERPIYADDPPMVGAKLIDLSVAAQEPVTAVAVGLEPSSAHAFALSVLGFLGLSAATFSSARHFARSTRSFRSSAMSRVENWSREQTR